jgi:hypothetical protein
MYPCASLAFDKQLADFPEQCKELFVLVTGRQREQTGRCSSIFKAQWVDRRDVTRTEVQLTSPVSSLAFCVRG